MTNHLRAIDIKEYAKALDVAKEFADRAEKAEAAVRRVRELIDTADTFTPPLVLTTAELRRALDGADEDNQADFWDGDVPLGGDDMDGK